MSSKQNVRITPSIKDFLMALLEDYTYDPFRNAYTIFGFLWGLPVPFFIIWTELTALNMPISLTNIITAIHNRPTGYFFLAHPILFAIVFGAMGTVRYKKDQQIKCLLDRLEKKVDELDKANEKLKELDRMKSDFLANVSHELKTPLVSVYGYTDMIATGRLGSISDKQKNSLEIVTRNIEKLLNLIDELLRFARLEANRESLRLEIFDIVELTRSSASLLKLTAEKKGLGVVEKLPPTPIFVRADKEKIGHVISNLFANAVKFTPVNRNVGIIIIKRGGNVVVDIWDEGDGIPQEALPHIFERFYQVDGSSKRRHGGVGLGLAIVKSILDAHKAPIYVDSRVSLGTTFKFELGVVPQPEIEKEVVYGKENISSR